ncbi:unnamed protein product [Brassica oleracea]
MISVPVSLNAAVRLGIADAIWNSGANSPLSASEILPRLLVPSRESPAYTCIFRTVPALTYGQIGNCHATKSSPNTSTRGNTLTDVGRTLVTDSNGLSYAAYVLQHHQEALMRALPLVHKAVVEQGTEPYIRCPTSDAYMYLSDLCTRFVILLLEFLGFVSFVRCFIVLRFFD